MRIAVCDDSIREQERVVQLLAAYDFARRPECFTSGRDLLAAAAKAPPFDIVFLDVYMPGENGVETAENLQALSPSTGIVFVTISMDHAVDAFSLRALHYLVKPVTAGGVEESLRRLAELQKKKSPIIVFPSGSGSYTVAVDEINYIQSVGHVKELMLTDGRVIRLWMSMEEMEKKLDSTFLKLNRSLIVNMEKIEQMGVGACMLKDGTRLEFARRERAAIHAAYDNYLFTRLNGEGGGRMGGNLMSFYLRHFAGFFIQFGAGIFLCLLPFAEGSFLRPRRQVVMGCSVLAVLVSAVFPVVIRMETIGFVHNQALIANLYMLLALLVFVIFYFMMLRVERVKKLIVLVLALFYAAAQYLLVNGILAQLPDGVMEEIYPPLTLAFYAATAAVMLPPTALIMGKLVKEFLAEMEIENIRREFFILLVVSFLYLAILVIYTSSPAGLLPNYWWWIVPPLLLVTVVLCLFYWSLFQESVRRKRDSEERRTLEIQKLQYESITREMEQTRRLRHDMRHSLNLLAEMLARGDEKAMSTYLSELAVQISHRDTTVYCRNVIINGLLQYYVGMAADSGIQCRVQADCGEITIAPVDLTTLLGNMMENAIRACEQEENRWITVEVGVIGGSMLIRVVNPCRSVHPSGRYRMDSGFLPAGAFVSGRAGGGYGLYSLEYTAGKYGGRARFKFDEHEHTFTARVQMNLYQVEL